MPICLPAVLQINIGTSWVALPGGYPPPAILRVSPTEVPIEGGALTINGSSFGYGPCADPGRLSAVLLRLTPAPVIPLTFNPGSRVWIPASALVPVDVNCTIVSWSDDGIVCRAPPGLDASVALRVVVGGQSVQATGPLRYGAPIVATVAAASPVSTAGGTLLTVSGAGFPLPPWPVAVLVGDAPCAVVTPSRVTSTSLTCVAPRGVGTVRVVVFTPLQGSNGTASLTYAPPAITNVSTPEGRPIAGGFTVQVAGAVRVC
jgi:hypothetical protein